MASTDVENYLCIETFTNSTNTNANNPKTLSDWVKNFRIKKVQMKRKLRCTGGQLRVCAILTTALHSAEAELRRKQHERFDKWIEMQSKLKYNSSKFSYNYNKNSCSNEYRSSIKLEEDEQEIKRRSEISDLWKSELSGLDQFMKRISSSCKV